MEGKITEILLISQLESAPILHQGQNITDASKGYMGPLTSMINMEQ